MVEKRVTAPITLLSEADFQSAVVELAQLQGWRVCHFSDSRRPGPHGQWVGDAGARGWPDLVLVRGPALLFRELKSEKGRITSHQQEWLDMLEGAKQDVKVWRPSDWDEIQRTLAYR